jgi:hypothetical protein
MEVHKRNGKTSGIREVVPVSVNNEQVLLQIVIALPAA